MADIKELAAVENVGERSALLIKTVASCISKYSLCDIDIRKPFSTFAQISEYLKDIYIGEANETVYLLLFNNSMRLITTERLCTGSVNDVIPNTRMIVETAYNYKASYAILAHNHPGGIAIPSSSDMEITYRISQALECVGINFIDHFVVAGNRCTPILHGPHKDASGKFEESMSCRLSASKSELESDLEKIFDIDKNS
jgi:DNA repair protein RadC